MGALPRGKSRRLAINAPTDAATNAPTDAAIDATNAPTDAAAIAAIRGSQAGEGCAAEITALSTVERAAADDQSPRR
jgi:hypothetical protein